MSILNHALVLVYINVILLALLEDILYAHIVFAKQINV